MSIFKPKEAVTIEEHTAGFLYAIYKFNPVSDFIRISRKGLLTEQELKRLKDEDHYLLTAQEMERLNWLWTKGKIANLSNKLDSGEVSDRLGYWFGYNLALVYGGISGKETAISKTEKALEAIQHYLKEIGDNNGVKLDLAYKNLATLFVDRVLGKGSADDAIYIEKRVYVNHFAEFLLNQSEKELQKPSFKLVYQPPKS